MHYITLHYRWRGWWAGRTSWLPSSCSSPSGRATGQIVVIIYLPYFFECQRKIVWSIKVSSIKYRECPWHWSDIFAVFPPARKIRLFPWSSRSAQVHCQATLTATYLHSRAADQSNCLAALTFAIISVQNWVRGLVTMQLGLSTLYSHSLNRISLETFLKVTFMSFERFTSWFKQKHNCSHQHSPSIHTFRFLPRRKKLLKL